ncbi:MAG: tetratricopeptide repeat protein [Spirochaetes bacterium]|nr:tetratricopeptide repeat protein [Spirochaetota bacterium]
MNLVFIAIVLTLLLVTMLIFFIVSAIKKFSSGSESGGPKNKDRNSIIKEANKKLERNPKDSQAILELADLYYSEETYDKSFHLYKLLLDKPELSSQGGEVDIISKYAVSALKTGKIDEAYKYLNYARAKNKDVFEVNYNLGVIDFDRKSYDKALSYFIAAKNLLPDHVATLQYIGKILFHSGRFKDAVGYLRKCFDLSPGDKEILYLLGQAYNESGQIENGYKIFSHLRPDPAYGPQASLEAGKIDIKKKNYPKAIEDMELGLRHKEIDPKIRLELLYQLGTTYILESKVSMALKAFDSILSISSNYKDVAALKSKYSELASNKNLKTYLMSPTSEFVNLCKRIAPLVYPKAEVKITDIKAEKNDYVDIVAEVTSNQMEDIALFRFLRATTPIGDIVLRDLYFKSKDVKAGQSYCFSAGSFTETAVKFVDARTIDLVSGKELTAFLSKATKGE